MSRALKQGCHPCTKAFLVSNSAIPKINTPLARSIVIEDSRKSVIDLLDYAFYMYWREVELIFLSHSSKLGCHPCTKAVLVAFCYSAK